MYDTESFEGWFDRRTLRLFDEPGRQVMVDMGRVDPSCGRPYAFAPGGVSLRVRAFGARIEPTMPAYQIAWLQLSTGLWRGICRMHIASANQLSAATISLWVPPEAITVQEGKT